MQYRLGAQQSESIGNLLELAFETRSLDRALGNTFDFTSSGTRSASSNAMGDTWDFTASGTKTVNSIFNLSAQLPKAKPSATPLFTAPAARAFAM